MIEGSDEDDSSDVSTGVVSVRAVVDAVADSDVEVTDEDDDPVETEGSEGLWHAHRRPVSSASERVAMNNAKRFIP